MRMRSLLSLAPLKVSSECYLKESFLDTVILGLLIRDNLVILINTYFLSLFKLIAIYFNIFCKTFFAPVTSGLKLDLIEFTFSKSLTYPPYSS